MEDGNRQFMGNSSKSKACQGFTLIELLVALSIVGVLSAIGLATYINFNRSQLISTSTKKILQDMRLAQSLAANNQKPEDCDNDTLQSYTFEVLTTTTYQITAECSAASYVVKSGDIPVNLSMTGFSKVKFKILRQGLVFTGGNTLTVAAPDFNLSKIITVGNAGEIVINEQ